MKDHRIFQAVVDQCMAGTVGKKPDYLFAKRQISEHRKNGYSKDCVNLNAPEIAQTQCSAEVDEINPHRSRKGLALMLNGVLESVRNWPHPLA